MPTFLDLSQARKTLAKMGISLTERQLKRAAEPDVDGRRKLPFFVDPIDKRLKIEKGVLTGIYNALHHQAQASAHYMPDDEIVDSLGIESASLEADSCDPL